MEDPKTTPETVPAQWPGDKTLKPGTEKTGDETTVIPVVR